MTASAQNFDPSDRKTAYTFEQIQQFGQAKLTPNDDQWGAKLIIERTTDVVDVCFRRVRNKFKVDFVQYTSRAELLVGTNSTNVFNQQKMNTQATTQLQPVILGNFALVYSTNEDEPYFNVTMADGTPVGDGLYSIEIDNVYETQRWDFLSDIKGVEDIEDREIALQYIRQTIDLNDFDSHIPESFNALEQDDRDYCYLICFQFALNRVYA